MPGGDNVRPGLEGIGPTDAFFWQGTDERIARAAAGAGLTDRIVVEVNGTSRFEVHADRVRFLNGGEVAQSEVADGAAGVGGKWRIKPGVDIPTTGYRHYVWSRYKADGTTEKKAMDLAWIGSRPILIGYDDNEAERWRLDAASGPSLGFTGPALVSSTSGLTLDGTGQVTVQGQQADSGSVKPIVTLWKSAVATPTAGAEALRIQWSDNVPTTRPVAAFRMITTGSARWAMDLYDAGGTGRLVLDPFGGQPTVRGVDTGGLTLDGNSGTAPIIVYGTQFKFGAFGDSICVPGTAELQNETGGTRAAGDVVILSTTVDRAVAQPAGTGNEDNPYVVVTGATSGADLFVAVVAKVLTVNVDTSAVARGDTLVTSSITAGRAMTNNAQTDPIKILGRALTAKSAGSNGTVTALVP